VTAGGREDWPGLVEHVATQAGEGDRLLTPAKYRPPFDYWWTEGREQPRPRLDPLSPVDPVGEVRRWYDVAPGRMRDRLLADTTATVWYVDRTPEGLERAKALAADSEVRRRYEPSGPWQYEGNLVLLRLDPRTRPLRERVQQPAAGAAAAL
jgi:hypothetical protein